MNHKTLDLSYHNYPEINEIDGRMEYRVNSIGYSPPINNCIGDSVLTEAVVLLFHRPTYDNDDRPTSNDVPKLCFTADCFVKLT